MFTTKKQLFETKAATKPAAKNLFLQGLQKQSAMTRSGNGASKFDRLDDVFVTEFGQASDFRKPRSYDEVANSMSTMWAKDPELTIKFALYLRAITRVPQLPDGTRLESPVRGQGLRSEAVMRFLWLGVNQKEAFRANLPLLVIAGGWRDVFDMLQTDLVYNGWDGRLLDWNFIRNFILAGLENPNTSELVKKWLPTIRAKSKCLTPESQANHMIGAWVANMLFAAIDDKASRYANYRRLKSSGTAHQWQQHISRGDHLKIDFDTVAGRALSQMVSGKYLENQGLTEKFEAWIEAKPVAKFTGYPYELFVPYIPQFSRIGSCLTAKPYQAATLNRQFAGLVETAKKGAKRETSLIVVRDTSGSMGQGTEGSNVSCNTIAKSLALFFSEMLPDGEFAGSWIEFNSGAKLRTWEGSNVVEKWNNDGSEAYGGTNFQSVIKLFCDMKQSGVPESEFPTGILCLSDGEFDPAELGQTNVEAARSKLRDAGFSEEYASSFQIVLWNLTSHYYGHRNRSFETFEAETENVFYFSGLDGSVVAFLTGLEGKAGSEDAAPKSAQELFDAAMDQELLNMVSLG